MRPPPDLIRHPILPYAALALIAGGAVGLLAAAAGAGWDSALGRVAVAASRRVRRRRRRRGVVRAG